MRILFQLSGSIAAYKACEAISRLVGAGHEVRVACTPSALRFVGRSTLEGLTGHPVFDDPFESGRAMDHVSLARWADALVLCPATAGTINRLAQGLADDALGALFLAHDFSKPYLIAPAMNHAMYRHPATQASLEKLGSWGVNVLSSPEGRQACGETGPGRLLDPEALVSAVLGAASPAAARGLRILVTSGATREPVDSVRFVTNVSTGRTGAALCDAFAAAGAEVTLLCGTGAARPGRSMRVVEYGDFVSLDRGLRDELSTGSFDAVVHAAAVSDFSVAGPKAGKIESASHDRLTLTLERNFKILDRLRSYSPAGRAPVIVGFKLTSTPSGEERARAVGALLAAPSGPDYVVHNDLGEMAGPEAHRFTILSGRGEVSAHDSAPGLAGALLEIFKREVRPA